MKAYHLKWIFETIALGIYSTEQVLLQARRNGAKIKRNMFCGQVKNPFYKGDIKSQHLKTKKKQLLKETTHPLYLRNYLMLYRIF